MCPSIAAALWFGSICVADTVTLKDGTKYENASVLRDDPDFLIIEVTIDGKKQQKIISRDEIKSHLKEASTAKPDAAVPPAAAATNATKPAEPKPADLKQPSGGESGKNESTDNGKGGQPSADTARPGDPKKKEDRSVRTLTGKSQRVAFLNFGLPQSAQGKAEDMVGREVNAWAWKHVIPMLEKDKIDIVVIRINSGGGALAEMAPFQNMYESEYKPRFRTVAWIENAISAAAMSPWPIVEMYFLPEGRIGACTAFNGGSMRQIPPSMLIPLLVEMEKVSQWANRDPKIMRSMQILEPLSATIDENGEVKWFQDASGEIIVNYPGEILTLTAPMAMKTKFARGIAATREELMEVMGVSEYVFAGEDAAKYIDRNIEDCDNGTKRISDIQFQYNVALTAADQLRGDPTQGAAIGRARQALDKLKQLLKINRNFAMFFGLTEDWFREQEKVLRELSKK